MALRNQVFISYAHTNAAWKDAFVRMLSIEHIPDEDDLEPGVGGLDNVLCGEVLVVQVEKEITQPRPALSRERP